jgi:hypothetical protein
MASTVKIMLERELASWNYCFMFYVPPSSTHTRLLETSVGYTPSLAFWTADSQKSQAILRERTAKESHQLLF